VARVLVVEDDPQVRALFCEAIEARGHAVRAAASATAARQIAADWRPHAAVIDLRLPEGDIAGFELARDLRAEDPSLICLLVTAYPDGAQGFQFGQARVVARFLVKPVLPRLVADALDEEVSTDRRPAPPVTISAPPSPAFHGMLGESAVMRRVFARAERLAPLDETVLIDGETGTGKELAAHAIHDLSNRRAGPFVAVNCSAIPDTLFESEFFGHERGAFTGAVGEHPGHFERARGGTLFLDEVGELSLAVQAKLLRVLQEPVIRRVGGTRAIPIDVRLIAATNRNLVRAVEGGAFRDDLRHRLTRATVSLPPVRDRGEDVDLLIDHYLERARLAVHRSDIALAAATRHVLASCRWPGNVREIENCLFGLVLEAGEGRAIQPEDLPATLLGADLGLNLSDFTLPAGMTWDEMTQAVESRLHGGWLRAALQEAGGNRSAAAARLGIDRRTLHRWLTQYGISA
jgi:DNA-binding NtrC family response regulator